MTWLLWRQHRLQGAVTSGLLAVLAILLAVTGVTMASDYRDALAGCSRPGFNCDNIKLFQGDGAIIDTVNATILVPVVIGMFWGATLVGREYDTGTNLLVWTQSVTRRHWLRTKIATLIISSALAGTALSVMVTWWSRTMNLYRGDNRFDPLQFDLQGLSPIAFTMFAAALGLLAGAAWRRTLPAIATTIAGFFGVRLAVELWLRPYYEQAITVAGQNGATPRGAWVLNTDLLYNGVATSGPVRVPPACLSSNTRADMTECMTHHGFRFSSTYQPADRYWTFQWIEAGIYVALAALLVGAAVIVVRRRDA
jgi:hypothetical protein